MTKDFSVYNSADFSAFTYGAPNTIQYSFIGAWQNASYTIIIKKMDKYND